MTKLIPMEDQHSSSASISIDLHQQQLHIDDETQTTTDTVEKLHQKGDVKIIVSEGETSELLQKTAKTEEEAYDMYNDYAFKVGFSVRKSRIRRRAKTGNLSMRQYCCSKAGTKKSEGRYYRKLETWTKCKAMIQYNIDKNGKYTVAKHHMIHNHALCPEDKRHLLRSQREVMQEDVDYLLLLIESGIKLSDALRALKKEKGGTPLVGFITKDAYNRVAKEKAKKLEGSDCMALLKVLAERKSGEDDFYYDFDVDDEGCLCRFFWRDARMKEDYIRFGDLLVHDTTYRTNKYDMICGPFIGINHHSQNIMFGCGFLVDEQTESFEWLFQTFSRSMDNVQPVTIMTDQSAAMAAAIKTVFPASNHRLCLWHLGENSKKNIGHLRALDGFVEMFKHVLMYCETQAEFEFYWKSMIAKYECADNSWLARLYNNKNKWCVPFTKDFFSAAVLSSQRSETTNHSVSRKLTATSGLYDFYTCYEAVVHDWRRRENDEDHRCQEGDPMMIASHVLLLQNARNIYTIEVFQLFQEQFIKSWMLHHVLVSSEGGIYVYHVGKPANDLIKHTVTMNRIEGTFVCTCKLFTEFGILCSHCVRVMIVNCIDQIPQRYILKRWTKDCIRNRPEQTTEATENSALSVSVWRTQMCRKFNELVTVTQLNERMRTYVEQGYLKIKSDVDLEIQSREQTEAMLENVQQTNQSTQQPETEQSATETTAIKDPKKKRKPGIRNIRQKPMVEKIYSVCKGKRAKSFKARSHTKKVVQNLVQQEVQALIGNGYLAHPPDGGAFLMQYPSHGHHAPMSTAISHVTAFQNSSSFNSTFATQGNYNAVRPSSQYQPAFQQPHLYSMASAASQPGRSQINPWESQESYATGRPSMNQPSSEEFHRYPIFEENQLFQN